MKRLIINSLFSLPMILTLPGCITIAPQPQVQQPPELPEPIELNVQVNLIVEEQDGVQPQPIILPERRREEFRPPPIVKTITVPLTLCDSLQRLLHVSRFEGTLSDRSDEAERYRLTAEALAWIRNVDGLIAGARDDDRCGGDL